MSRSGLHLRQPARPRAHVHSQHDILPSRIFLFVHPVFRDGERRHLIFRLQTVFCIRTGNSLTFHSVRSIDRSLARSGPTRRRFPRSSTIPSDLFSFPSYALCPLARIERNTIEPLRSPFVRSRCRLPFFIKEGSIGVELLDVVGSTEATTTFSPIGPGRAKAGQQRPK